MKKVYFDIESTGPDASKDQIVELAILMTDEEGKILLKKAKRYKPTIPISPEAEKTHGISDKMVAKCPRFQEDAKNLKKIFENSIIITYNGIKFDIPLLMAEFDRAGVELDLSGQVIDVMRLETALNPRTLSAVYKRYFKKELDGAHGAIVDAEATKRVLEAQLERISKEGLKEEEMLEAAGIPPGSADLFGKLKWSDDGNLLFNFGKHVGLAVLLNSDTKQYANWILTQNFPGQVKRLLQEELKKDTASQFKRKKSSEQGFYKPPNRQRTILDDPDPNEHLPVDDLPF